MCWRVYKQLEGCIQELQGAKNTLDTLVGTLKDEVKVKKAHIMSLKTSFSC